MRTCLGCGAELTRPSQKVYCSIKCQWALKRRRRVELWLESGQGVADSHQGHYVREHIATEQQGLCALCEQPSVWNGLRLVLLLDHIDGDSTNNGRANLRLICPNCDSQLPTFKMRNKGRGRYSRRQRYAAGMSY